MKRVISFILFLVCFFSFNSILVAQAIEEKAAGRIISLSGSVTVTSGTASSSAKPFQNLNAGDIVFTGPGSRAAILLRDESLVKLNANSTLCSKDSPIPRMPPQQTSKPSALAFLIDSISSSKVWVVTMLGKYERAVSILW